MPLGLNRKYNNLCGLPVTGSDLQPSSPDRGTGAIFGTHTPCIVEQEPKTGSGLPSGDDAEQYIVDFGPSVWEVNVDAAGGNITPGTHLNVRIATSGNYGPGNFTNATPANNLVVSARGALALGSVANNTQAVIEVALGMSATS